MTYQEAYEKAKKLYPNGTTVIATNGEKATINGPLCNGVRAEPLFRHQEEIWGYVERAGNVPLYVPGGFWAKVVPPLIDFHVPGFFYIATISECVYVMEYAGPGHGKYPYAGSRYVCTNKPGHGRGDFGLFERIEREANTEEVLSWFGQEAYDKFLSLKNQLNANGNTKSGQTVQIRPEIVSDREGKGFSKDPIQGRHRQISLTRYDPEHATSAVRGKGKIRRP